MLEQNKKLLIVILIAVIISVFLHVSNQQKNNYREQIAQTSETMNAIPNYLEKLAKKMACKTFSDCKKAITSMIKEDPVKWVGLVDNNVDLKKAPKDFTSLVEKIKKEIAKAKDQVAKQKADKAKKLVEQKAKEEAAKKKVQTQVSTAKNPCPIIDEVQWLPIPPLPQATKLCFGKRGTDYYILAPSKSPQFPPYYFKTSSPKCAEGESLAVKQDASGIECSTADKNPFTFTWDYCPSDFVLVPRPEDDEKPKHCFGFLQVVGVWVIWPFNAASSSYAGLPETEFGTNVICDYPSNYVRAMDLKGTTIKCLHKDDAKDISNKNDTKVKFTGYRLSDHYSLVFPLPNIFSTTSSVKFFEDQGAVATMCAQSKYAMWNKTFAKLTYQICKRFSGR